MKKTTKKTPVTPVKKTDTKKTPNKKGEKIPPIKYHTN